MGLGGWADISYSVISFLYVCFWPSFHEDWFHFTMV